MERTGPSSDSSEEGKKIPMMKRSDSVRGDQVCYPGCLPAINRIIDYVPQIFWPNLRGTTRPMKFLVEERLSKLRVLSYPAEFPGKKELQELVEAQQAPKIRDGLVKFFAEYAPNLTDMPGGLYHFLPSTNHYYDNLRSDLKELDGDISRYKSMTLHSYGKVYSGCDPLLKKVFQNEYPFNLRKLNLETLKIAGSCLFNHENLLRLPNLETFIFPRITYSGFEEDFKYVTECPKVEDITLPAFWDHPEHCKSALEPCKTLKRLFFHGCPDSLPEKYFDRLLSESCSLNSIRKSSRSASANFYRKLALVPNLKSLDLNLCATIGQRQELFAQVENEHREVLSFWFGHSVRFLTNLNLECLVSWHDCSIIDINVNLENLTGLKLRFKERYNDFQTMADRTLHFYLDLQIVNLDLSYEVIGIRNTELVKIELQSGPQLRANLQTLDIQVNASNHTVDDPFILVDTFVEEFLRECSKLYYLEFGSSMKKRGFKEEVTGKIKNLKLPELSHLRVRQRTTKEDSRRSILDLW